MRWARPSLTSDAGFLAYASVVDSASGDARFRVATTTTDLAYLAPSCEP